MAAKKIVRIGFTGGGSGGHVYPLLAVAEELNTISSPQEAPDILLYYFGPADEYEPAIRLAKIKPVHIAGPKWRRYASIQNIIDIPKFFFALFQAWWKLFWIMPDVVFSKGGPGALPVVFMARFYRIPVMIHESDSIPGLTNLLSSRFASKIFTSFETALKYFDPRKTVLVGNPIRRVMLANRASQETAKKDLGFTPDQPLVMVLGGSQGSERINDFILINLTSIVRQVQVLHQVGRANFIEMQKLTRAALMEVALHDYLARYKAVPYLDKEYTMAFTAADLIVGRAGSGAIFEIAAFHKPSILIPLTESANDHQRANAYEFSKTGAAIVIEESNLFYGIFEAQVKAILNDPTKLESMAKAAEGFAKPDAAEKIAVALLQTALPGLTIQEGQ